MLLSGVHLCNDTIVYGSSWYFGKYILCRVCLPPPTVKLFTGADIANSKYCDVLHIGFELTLSRVRLCCLHPVASNISRTALQDNCMKFMTLLAGSFSAMWLSTLTGSQRGAVRVGNGACFSPLMTTLFSEIVSLLIMLI